jgi:hypothetical protein
MKNRHYFLSKINNTYNCTSNFNHDKAYLKKLYIYMLRRIYEIADFMKSATLSWNT